MAESTEVRETSRGSAGLSPQEQLQHTPAGVLNMIQTAQEVQKRLNDKSLQPSLAETLLNIKGLGLGNPSLEYKAQQREMAFRQLQGLQSHMFQQGMDMLIPALYKPMKDEEITQLAQQYMSARTQAFSLGRQMAAPFVQNYTAPVTSPLMVNVPTPEGGQMMQQVGRPVTPAESAARLSQSLMSPETGPGQIVGASAYGGEGLAKLLAGQQTHQLEQRQFQAAEPIINLATQRLQQQGQAPGPVGGVTAPTPTPPQGPVPAGPTSVTGLPNIPKGREPIASALIDEAKKQQVSPALILGMARAESNFDPGAISKAGAHGVMQLMPDAATDMGIDPASRMVPAQNIPAGIGYFKRMLALSNGDIPSALERYNVGPQAYAEGTRNPQYVKDVLKYTAEYEQALGQAPSTGAQFAGPGATAPQAQPIQGHPFQLPAFESFGEVPRLEGLSVAGGKPSFQLKFPTLEEKTGAYLQHALTGGGWRQFQEAQNRAVTGGGTPPRGMLEQLRQQASNQAYWEMRNKLRMQGVQEPYLHIQAMQAASEATGGFFTGQALGDMQNPVALKRAETAAGLLGQVDPGTAQAAQELAQRAGEQTRQTTTAGIEATTEARANQLTGEVIKAPRHAIYTGTGDQPLGRVYPPHAKYNAFLKDFEAGKAYDVSDKELEGIQSLQRFSNDMNIITEKLNKVYGPGGLFEKATGVGGRLQAGAQAKLQGWTQSDPAYVTAAREVNEYLTVVARKLNAEVGRIPIQEIANFYAGVLPQLQGMPDSPAVAHQLITDVQRRIAEHIGATIGQPDYQLKHVVKPNFESGPTPTQRDNKIRD